MATATAPLQTVHTVRRVYGKSYITLSCGHCTVSSKVLAVGDRFQCRSADCRDAARQAAMDAQNLASRIAGALGMRLSESPVTRGAAASTSEVMLLADLLKEKLAWLACIEQD